MKSFVRTRSQQAQLRALSTPESKKGKDTKQKALTISDELKKQLEKAMEEAKKIIEKIENYIVRSSLFSLRMIANDNAAIHL